MGPHPASDQHPTEVTSFLESTRRAGGWWVPGSRAAVADQSLRARAPTLPGCASLDQLGCSRRARAGSRVLPVSHLSALLWGCSLEPGLAPQPPPAICCLHLPGRTSRPLLPSEPESGPDVLWRDPGRGLRPGGGGSRGCWRGRARGVSGERTRKRFLVLSKVFTLRKSHRSSLPSPAVKGTDGALASSKEEEDSRLLGFSENQEITKKTEVLEDGVMVARGRESREFGKDRYTRLCLFIYLFIFLYLEEITGTALVA